MPCNNTSTDQSSEETEIKGHEKSKVSTNCLNVSQNKMVRTDCSEQKIDKFLNTSGSSSVMLSKSKTENVVRCVLRVYYLTFGCLTLCVIICVVN